MTEQEKKAIEELKEEINKPLEVPEDKFDTFILYNIESARTTLNLIETQQKEIEELKKYKEGYKLLNYALDNYISKDKIKAKIEPKLKELDKQINEEWKKYGNSRELQDMEDMYNFLQSLLKEE